MATSTAVKTEQPGQIDLSALKTKQHGAWSSGDYAIVGTTLQIVGEELCEALDLRAGQKVLDVAAGNGNATLAAARRWCEVISTDYVPSLLERGRARAAAKACRSSSRRPMPRPSLRRCDFRCRALDLRRDVHADQDRAASELLRVCKAAARSASPTGRQRALSDNCSRLSASICRRRPALNRRRCGARSARHGDVRNVAASIKAEKRHFKFRYRSPMHFLDVFKTYYGPTLKAFAALDETNQRRLADDILKLIAR